MAIVYQHRRNDSNEIFYIGIGKSTARAYEKNSGRTIFWKNVAKKSGFSVDILINGCSIEDAKAVEIGLIQAYGRRDLGTGNLVNLTDGGDGTLNAIVLPHIRKKISTSMKGKNTWMKGKKHTEETRDKMRRSSKRLKHTPEFIRWLSESRKGDKSPTFGKLPYNTLPIINTNTNEIYKSIKECATKNGIKITNFQRWLKQGKKDFPYKIYKP